MKDNDKKILDWLGFKRGKRGINKDYFTVPREKYYTVPVWELDVDLNFLFEYAYPQLKRKFRRRIVKTFLQEWVNKILGDADPTEAFKEALIKLIESKE